MTYYDDFRDARDDARRVGWRDPLEQSFRFELVTHLLGEGSVLDAGCGVGDLLGHLQKRGLGNPYLGIDRREAFVRLARAKWGEHFEVAEIRTFSREFDWLVAIGATVGGRDSMTVADLEESSHRCGARGIFFVLEKGSAFDPALGSSDVVSPFMRPLRGEALLLTWQRTELLDLGAAYDRVADSVDASVGERARLAFNAGLYGRARDEISRATSDPLAELIQERLEQIDTVD